jgi:hypothetical protein
MYKAGDTVKTTVAGGAVPAVGVVGLVGTVVEYDEYNQSVPAGSELGRLGYVALVSFGGRPAHAMKADELELVLAPDWSDDDAEVERRYQEQLANDAVQGRVDFDGYGYNGY